MKYPELVNGELDYTKICLSALRRIPESIRDSLKKSGRWEDIAAWAIVAAVESYNEKLTAKDSYNLSQKLIYKALKYEGFRKVRIGKKMIWRYKEFTETDLQIHLSNMEGG